MNKLDSGRDVSDFFGDDPTSTASKHKAHPENYRPVSLTFKVPTEMDHVLDQILLLKKGERSPFQKGKRSRKYSKQDLLTEMAAHYLISVVGLHVKKLHPLVEDDYEPERTDDHFLLKPVANSWKGQ